MKIIKLMSILIFICFELNSLQGQTNIQYSIKERNYFLLDSNFMFIEILLKNVGTETYIMWITDDLKNEMNEDFLINDYFLKQKGDFILLNLIYENLYQNLDLQIGFNFLKKIEPNESFSFIFIYNKIDSDFVYNFNRNYVVIIDEKKLKKFMICDKKDLFYSYSNIVLYSTIFNRKKK